MIRPFAIAALMTGLAAPHAGALNLPAGAARQAMASTASTSAHIAIGPFGTGGLPAVMADGDMTRTAWKITQTQLTTLQLVRPLRTQLVADGYDIIFECADVQCGGFDFRFAQDVLPEPDMHVNLGDYRYLAALRGDGDNIEYLTLMVSRSPGAGYVQITRIGGDVTAANEVVASTKAAEPDVALALQPSGPIGEALTSVGHAALDDLEFDSGSASLGAGDFASLAALADWLKINPQARVTLVGHTDATGSLAANEALSRRRASSVRARLVDVLGVPAGQVQADGVGYLSPRASNLTDQGREQNRRVEVVLTSTR